MNLSLRRRIATSFVSTCLIILILTFTVFHFLNGLNKKVESISAKSNRISLLTDEIRISAVSILKYQRRILSGKDEPGLVDKITSLCESLATQLQSLDVLFEEAEVKKVIAQMQTYVDSLRVVLNKSSYLSRDAVGMSTVGELADKILDAYSEFQDIQYFQSVERDKQITKIIKDTKKNMMITLIIGFLGTILLGLVIPNKVSLPFKKIKDAIRELQDCNFDVSIYYNQKDEIGEIATEMNKMIHNFKIFEELRADRINVEHRKFDALASMTKKHVLVVNADGRIMYLNNSLYSLLQVQSDQVLERMLEDAPIPQSIVAIYDMALKRRSKLENEEIIIEPVRASEDQGPLKPEEIFKGYANVVPIRGKQTNLDYYLMVLSRELFT
jgi:signal transduction histidine kinase